MPKGLLDKSYAEDKVGRKLDLQAQRLRAKACTLSGAAMFGDQPSVQSSPRRSTVDEEKLTKFVRTLEEPPFTVHIRIVQDTTVHHSIWYIRVM